MRFIIAPEFYEQMKAMDYHTPDCYVRPGEYLHHLYLDGVKYTIVPALRDCLAEAKQKNDQEAIHHLELHQTHYEILHEEAARLGSLEGVTLLGDPPPDDHQIVHRTDNPYTPSPPSSWEDLGLSIPFLAEMVMRTIYSKTRLAGGRIAELLRVPFGCIAPVLKTLRKQTFIDIVGQGEGGGDASIEYEIKPPKGTDAIHDALEKTSYVGPLPVPLDDYIEAIMGQTVRKLSVTRRSIYQAYEDLVMTDAVFNEIGPAINSTQSIFFFGAPGNGKTSIAERITRLMGDEIYIPHAVEVNGQIIKLYDPILHKAVPEDKEAEPGDTLIKKEARYDQRFIKIKRPTVVVGGELTLPMLDLRYNDVGKFYEAPLQMKANGGIFMIDDFGRQQMRPMDLLNRWIVPLEKKYDYLTTVSGMKIEIPFDVLLIFSTNLDPAQLADEAFLRRIKFKIEIRDPEETQYRDVWRLVCRTRKVEYDEKGINYLIKKWYHGDNRPFRMCQPRDLLDQMIAIAKYNMERVNFSPDLINAACETYFIHNDAGGFGAGAN